MGESDTKYLSHDVEIIKKRLFSSSSNPQYTASVPKMKEVLSPQPTVKEDSMCFMLL